MKYAYPILMLASLTACSTRLTEVAVFPVPAALTDLLQSPCPPLSLISDKTIAALVRADEEAAGAYAQCQAKHHGVVAAYMAARDDLIAAAAKAEKAK